MRTKSILFFYLVLIGIPGYAQDQFRVANVFGDNMVLQRGKNIAIWGWDQIDQEVTVNSISVSGNTITYVITAGQPAIFVTLKTDKPGYVVQSVSMDGDDHCHFGDCYVHLPRSWVT